MPDPTPTHYDHCPAAPCSLCRPGERTNLSGLTNWQWCQSVDACAASIDWDKVYSHA